MNRIFICLTALLLLAACNNTSEQNNSEAGNGNIQTETAAAPTDQGDWNKQNTLLGSKPMVVDFFATWCGPCKELAPILDEIEQKHQGEVIFKRIDVDQEPELAQEFRVEAIPTLLFVAPNGDYQTIVGLAQPQEIEDKIAQLLKHSRKSTE
ncbi:MAG: thioredoxin family protein [Muribaculaceae bacterium]|nr:thioredoxin family protein [Muribaculaceae bacterium]